VPVARLVLCLLYAVLLFMGHQYSAILLYRSTFEKDIDKISQRALQEGTFNAIPIRRPAIRPWDSTLAGVLRVTRRRRQVKSHEGYAQSSTYIKGERCFAL
jgi:hypothetical protein